MHPSACGNASICCPCCCSIVGTVSPSPDQPKRGTLCSLLPARCFPSLHGRKQAVAVLLHVPARGSSAQTQHVVMECWHRLSCTLLAAAGLWPLGPPTPLMRRVAGSQPAVTRRAVGLLLLPQLSQRLLSRLPTACPLGSPPCEGPASLLMDPCPALRAGSALAAAMDAAAAPGFSRVSAVSPFGLRLPSPQLMTAVSCGKGMPALMDGCRLADAWLLSPLFALEHPTSLLLSSSVSSSSAPMPSLWLRLHTALSQGITAVCSSLKANLSQLSALLVPRHPICSPSPAVCRTSLLAPSAC